METTNSAELPREVPSMIDALEAHVAAFEARRGRVYGLQDWTGLQILGRAEVTTSRWHEHPSPAARHQALTLKYLAASRDEGWDDPDRPFVHVTTTDDTDQSLPWHLVVRAERTRPYEQSEELTPDAALRNSQRLVTTIPVDGVLARAELLTRNDCFASQVTMDGSVVILVGRSVPFGDLKLVRVDDLSPAVDAWRRVTGHLRG